MPKPLFEHPHFAWLADWLANGLGSPHDSQAGLSESLATALATTNPNFNRARFLAAASGEPASRRDKL